MSLVPGSSAPHVAVEGFDGPLDLLLEMVEEKRIDILTVRLGDLADEYLARVRALAALPAAEVAEFLALASRLVLLKARSLLPSLAPDLPVEEGESEEDLRARIIEYATTRERAAALGDKLRAGSRAFHREGGASVTDLPPRGGDSGALAAAWAKVLALAAMGQREEDLVAPGERYSVEQRTGEIEALVALHDTLTFGTLLGDRPTLGFAIVTFIGLLDLYRRLVIEIAQDELFGEITIMRKTARMTAVDAPAPEPV